RSRRPPSRAPGAVAGRATTATAPCRSTTRARRGSRGRPAAEPGAERSLDGQLRVEQPAPDDLLPQRVAVPLGGDDVALRAALHEDVDGVAAQEVAPLEAHALDVRPAEGLGPRLGARRPHVEGDLLVVERD